MNRWKIRMFGEQQPSQSAQNQGARRKTPGANRGTLSLLMVLSLSASTLAPAHGLLFAQANSAAPARPASAAPASTTSKPATAATKAAAPLTGPAAAQAAMNETLSLIEAGKLPDALNAIKKALAADPNRVEAHLLYIRLMIDTKQRSAAQAEYQKRRDAKGDALSLVLYGRTLEDPAQMEATFQKALQMQPNLGWAQYCLATLHMQNKQLDKAIADLETAVKLQPTFYQALESLGTLYVMKENYTTAIQRYSQAVALNPSNAETLYQLGSLQGRQGDIANGVSNLERARKLAPGNPMVLNNLAFLYFKQKRYDESLATYDAVLKLMPELSEARLNRETVARVKKGEIKYEAVTAMEKAMSASNPNEALAAYRRVIEISPNFELPYLAMGQILAVMGKVEDAEKSFKRAVELNPNFVEGVRLLAEFYLVAGNAAKAEPYLTKAIKASPREPQLYAALGTVYARMGDAEKAEASFNTAAKLLPSPLNLPSRLNKSRALFVQGRYKDEIRELTTILQEAPNFNGAIIEMANCQFALENFEGARIWYKKALKNEPDNADVKALLKAVDDREADFKKKGKDSMRASQILVKTQSEADAALRELKAGVEFGVLARKHSISPEGKTGGDLGFFKAGEVMPEIEKTVQSLKVGQVSGAVKTSRGYHIIKRLN